MARSKGRSRLGSQSRQALAHYEAGRYAEAEAKCRNILVRDRRDLTALQVLGSIKLKQGRYEEAATHLQACVAIRPNEAVMQCTLGTIRLQQGRLEQAVEQYDRALKLNPSSGLAIALKADALNKLGRIDEALAVLEPHVEAGTEDGDIAVAYATLLVQGGRPAEAVAAAEAPAGRTDLPAELRSQLYYLLGRAWEKLGDYDRSFHAYREANRVTALPSNAPGITRLADRLIEVFETLAALPRAGNDSELPILVVGMPRSGTTLVEQIIHAHPRAHGAGELPALRDAVEAAEATAGGPGTFPECVRGLRPPQVERLSRGYMERLCEACRDADRIVDKQLTNYLYLGLAAMLLPAARVIYCRRDALDCCFSCFANRLEPSSHPYASDLAGLGRVYRQTERLREHWMRTLPLKILEVHNEELVERPEQVIRGIIEFCGLPWDDACLEFHTARRAVTTLSYDQVRRPIFRSSLGRGRRFEKHLGPLREALGL